MLKTDWGWKDGGGWADSNNGSMEASQMVTAVCQGKGEGDLDLGQFLFQFNYVLLFLHTTRVYGIGTRLLSHFYADIASFLSPAMDKYLQNPLPASLEPDLTSITSHSRVSQSHHFILLPP